MVGMVCRCCLRGNCSLIIHLQREGEVEIHKETGELAAECNECGEEHFGGTLYFAEFLADLKAKQWRIRREDDEWVHLCPECGLLRETK